MHTHMHTHREILTQPQGAEEQQQDYDSNSRFALHTHSDVQL